MSGAVTYIGDITGFIEDKLLLEGLGILIGQTTLSPDLPQGIDFVDCIVPNLDKLDSYWGRFTWQLAPMSEVVQ